MSNDESSNQNNANAPADATEEKGGLPPILRWVIGAFVLVGVGFARADCRGPTFLASPSGSESWVLLARLPLWSAMRSPSSVSFPAPS